MASSTVEDYLKAIWLEQQRTPAVPRVATGRLAEALELAPSTVTAMVKTLAVSGLVDYAPYGGVLLTPQGRELALHVLRRHRLVELFLVQVMGMDWSEVHDEADALEHAVSDRLIERIDDLLGNPSVDPHGDPIPSATGEMAQPELATLLTCSEARVRVCRVADQSPEFLQLVERRGLKPNSTVRVLSLDRAADSVELEADDGRRFSLGLRAASKILVSDASDVHAGEASTDP